MLNCLFVGAGGFIGSVCRYLIGLIPYKSSMGFPVHTFIINIVGAFILGVIVSFADKSKTIDPKMMLFLKVGICGGFTTFSTFAYEVSDLINSNQIAMGITYAVLSAILGVLAVLGGCAIK